jgi:predicted MFS family arabinose efflux permease
MLKIIELYKNAFGGLSKQVWLLSLVMFINRSGTMVVAFLSLYLTKNAQFTIQQAGIAMMCFGLGAFLGAWLGGKITDIRGHYYVQFYSLFISGILFFFIGITHNFYFICTLLFVLSVFGDAYRPANQVAIAAYSSPENFTRSVSLVRLAINLGWAIGPALGGILAYYDYQYLFYADGITNIFAAALVFKFLKENHKVQKVTISKKEKSQDSPLKDHFFLWFLFFSTVYALGFFPLFTVMGLYYQDVLHFNTLKIGFIMASNGAAVVMIEMILLYKIQGKFNPIKLIILGCFLLFANFLIIFSFDAFWIILLAMFLASLSEIFAMPFMNTITIERAKAHNRGQYSALYAMTWAISHTLAPVYSTQIISKYGYQVLILIFAGLALFSMFGFMLIKKYY